MLCLLFGETWSKGHRTTSPSAKLGLVPALCVTACSSEPTSRFGLLTTFSLGAKIDSYFSGWSGIPAVTLLSFGLRLGCDRALW